ILDELVATIGYREAFRTFRDAGLTDIHGTSSIRNPGDAKLVRDQIECWTRHGEWVREDGIEIETETKTEAETGTGRSAWAARKHLGNPSFVNVCDARFKKTLDQNASYGGFGEFDQIHQRWNVREAVKYRWVPDESICGPGTGTEAGTVPGPGPWPGTQSPPGPPRPPGQAETNGATTVTAFRNETSIYQRFNVSQFCSSLYERNVLVVGDVTQHQIHDSILSAVGNPVPCTGELGCVDSKASNPICVNSTLSFVRNDLLSVPTALNNGDSTTTIINNSNNNNNNNSDDNDFSSGVLVEQPWATEEMFQKYRIVVLNKGLIWRTDVAFLTRLVSTIKYVWKWYPNVMFIYRATHPLSDCTVLKEQREDEAIAGPDGKSVVPGTKVQRPLEKALNRAWEDTKMTIRRPTLADVQRQNRLAKLVVENAGGIFLDTEEMFARRPDGRVGDGGDCARFCAPGPIDVYAELLYNALRILPGPLPDDEIPPPTI
ncbi:hypothetical protein BGZ54_003727, partial [Gamsiella multidivaricata]